MNNSKRKHFKTRSGCNTCKQRKIKCDERKPACNNCIKHSVQCGFATTDPSSSSNPTNDPVVAGVSQVIPSSQNLCMQDLELLHNFCTSTCFTLSYDPALRILWRINVPQLSFSYDYVMRVILAVSGLHLAYFNHERRDFYIKQSMTHYQIGLQIASSSIPNISVENCSALYIFSALTGIFALASPREPGDFLLFAESGTPEWFLLFRGIRSIFEMSSTELLKGVLSPIFSSSRRRIDVLKSRTTDVEHLSELRHLIATTVMEAHASQVYADTIDTLDRSFKIVYGIGEGVAEISDVFTWPYSVTDEYLVLLRQRTQEALSIFAYFCMLLKALDSYWWMNGWSQHLISKLHSLLDEEHRLWIRWPIEEIGVVL